jgi:hypothetical protein
VTIAIPDTWRVADGLVPAADVARSVEPYGVGYPAVSKVLRSGLVPVAKVGGQGGARHLKVDDAMLLLAVAALAVAAGMAFGVMLRAVRSAGGTVTAAGLTIPLPQAA